MSGTIMIGPETSIDVRTVDFFRIVEALRSESANWSTASRLLETIDNFGMNMICADELDAADFSQFAGVLEKLQDNNQSDESDFNRFLTDLRSLIARDKRLLQPIVR